jgi:hypothetical protein
MSITNPGNFIPRALSAAGMGGLMPQQPVGVNQVLAGPQNIPGADLGVLGGLNVNLGAINQTNDLTTLIGAANAVKAPRILGANGIDLEDPNSNMLSQLLAQTKAFTADTAGITGSMSPIQQTLGQVNKAVSNAGITTPINFNINDIKQIGGQIDQQALASTQALLSNSSLKGNFFFSTDSNARIKGRPDPNANPLAALLAGSMTGSFSGAGSDQQLGGLGQGILQLLSQAAAGGGAGVAPQAPVAPAAMDPMMMLMSLFSSLLTGGGVTPQQ